MNNEYNAVGSTNEEDTVYLAMNHPVKGETFSEDELYEMQEVLNHLSDKEVLALDEYKNLFIGLDVNKLLSVIEAIKTYDMFSLQTQLYAVCIENSMLILELEGVFVEPSDIYNNMVELATLKTK